jgi:hypothetical protein
MHRHASRPALQLHHLAAAIAIAVVAIPPMSGAAPPGAHAGVLQRLGGATHVVTNCDDAGPGSLREAYAQAQDQDTVDLNALACSSITLASPLRSAPTPGYVAIVAGDNGPVTISGNGAARVFEHGDGRLTLRGLLVRDGRANDADGGGCVLSQGEVVLQQSTVTGCETRTTGATPALGGAVRAIRLVALIDSEVSASTAHAADARAEGGGVHGRYLVLGDGTLRDNVVSAGNYHPADGGGAWAERSVRIDRSTLSGNRATRGGALFATYALFDELEVINSTISGNSADGAGGGLYSQAPVALHNSTITGNDAVFEHGAGVYVGAGALEANSSIIAGNTSGQGLNASDIGGHAGRVVTGSHNLVIASSRPLPPDTLQADPMLAPLADNGGFKMTHALLPGSPAIDAGSNPHGLQTDQRFIECLPTLARGCLAFERVVGDSADIGAFEFGAPDRIFGDGFDWEI